MKYLLPMALLAGPALAHDGTHLHPHGAGEWIAAAAALSVVAAVIAIGILRK